MSKQLLRALMGAVALLLGSSHPALAHDPKSPAPGDLRAAGAVDFPISCSPASQAPFNRGVALLHSFFYEEARNIFAGIAERDPSCAMAQWGVAQTWWHPIWAPPNPDEMAAGSAAARKAMALPSTPRERAFIEAIHTYYETPPAKVEGPVGQSCHGPVGPRERVVAYEQAMRRALDASPRDVETQVFHAFAVLAVGYATPLDTTLANQKMAGQAFDELWKTNPRHPGIVHYIIHSYDYPPLAARALPAAKVYADIAPWVPHALHMPSHIFTRLGMWDEAVATNQASADASRGYQIQQKRSATESQELHALDYMMYSYLQQARDGAARQALDRVDAVEAIFPEFEFAGAYALASIPARYVLERNAWGEAAKLAVRPRPHWEKFPFVESLFEYAHALGRARTGDVTGAQAALARMRALRDATTDPRYDYFRRHLDLQIQAASAWIAHAEGRGEEAVAVLRATADAEDALGKHPVTPGALVPAREQLGDMLLLLGRPQDALATYEAGLRIYPARFNSLYGAAHAAEKAGDRTVARQHYETLVKQAAKADSPRAELIRARAYLAANPAPAVTAGLR
jgi:tetratricopeptide (TPR) repeat protein